jgi:cysteine-rich repeat protein
MIMRRADVHSVKYALLCSFAALLAYLAVSALPPSAANAQVYVATTTVTLTVCGDGLVAPSEFCDDGVNSGAYSSTIAGRNCNPTCTAWGPYCGDTVGQVFYGEECDDGNNDAGDFCAADCQNETEPVVVGGSGGGSSGGGGRSSGGNGIDGAVDSGTIPFEGATDVRIVGRACPGSTITVLRDGEIERVIESDSTANFNFTLTDQTPGITTLGFWAVDGQNRRSITYSATFQVVENAITTLAGILLPPTLIVDPDQIEPGGTVSFEGCALPTATVGAYVDDGEVPEETIAAASGEYVIAYSTASLAVEAYHTVKANYVDPDNTELTSGHSQIVNFYVGNASVPTGLTADLNNDGFVNLTDFSILLFNWNTGTQPSDINQDGVVSLPDFSIMLFYWTG